MHGLGNDYIYIDCTKKYSIKNLINAAKNLSNRHFGIGSDGLVLISSSNIADFKMQIINSDGSQAQMCGNGIRCVGKFIFDNKLSTKTNLTIETLAGIKKLQLNLKNNSVDTVTVDMGKPIFTPEKIPLLAKNNSIEINSMKITCLSLGNPHAVTIVNDINKIDVEKIGPFIENDKHFPQKTNVEFMEIVNKNYIKMKVWERGSGLTLACGTGACACCVAAIKNNFAHKNENIKVELPGGFLTITWRENIFMTGPATTVFTGKIDEKLFGLEEF